MMRVMALTLAAGLAALLTGCSGEGPESTLDAVYTAEQAQRGARLFDQHCARCHSREEFSGRMFDTIWTGQSLHPLFDRIATTMPMDQPGSLGNDQVTALLAHLLALNDMPSGNDGLIADREWLASIRIELPE